jgi:hypothetical protein
MEADGSANLRCALPRSGVAVADPAAKVEMMRKKGDKDGADVWLRIIVAITHAGRAAG